MSIECCVGALKASRPPTGIADAKTDRRSPTRLRFVAGWRRTITSDHENSASDVHVVGETPRVGVWVARNESLLRARSSFSVLTDDDWAALAQLRAETTRNSAMAAKILLRLGLSQAVGRRIEPRDWRFQRTLLGKPLVSTAMPGVNFSVSHAGSVTVVAISPSLNLGIDVELIDQDVTEGTVAGFCDPLERTVLQKLGPAQKAREFIRVWTQKEAYTKLLGSGHSTDFSSIRCWNGTVAAGDANLNANAESDSSILFESFFVSQGSSLYHVSLAVDAPKSKVGSIDVQLIDVLGPDRIRSLSSISVVV